MKGGLFSAWNINEMSIIMSYIRGLLVYSLFCFFLASCSSEDNNDSEMSGNENGFSGDGTKNDSRLYRDENYDNLPKTDNSDTLYFYDQDPSKTDTSGSSNYEPGPDKNIDTAFIEGDNLNNHDNFAQDNEIEPESTLDFSIDSAYSAKIDITKQTSLAKELFVQLTNTSDKKSQKSIYREIIIKCPDTQEAQLAYYKLANIMMFEESEPDYFGVIRLLKDFHIRYTKSSRLNTILPFLLRAYEELNKWDKIAEVYAFIFRNNPDVLKKDLIKHSYKFAQALERTRRKDEAIVWYRKTLEKDNGKDNNIFINLARTRLSDLENNKND